MYSFIDLRVATVALLFLGASLGLGMLTAWFWRNARLESPVLAPLEVMSERRFSRLSDDLREEALTNVRGLASGIPTPEVAAPKPERPIRVANSRRIVPLVEVDVEDHLVESGPVTESSSAPIDPLIGRRKN